MADEQNFNINDVNAGNVNIGGNQNFYGPTNIYHSQSPVTRADISDDAILHAFDLATARLANIRGTFADINLSISRLEVEKILTWISQQSVESKDHNIALVTGKPGQGKSVVMKQLTFSLREKDYVVLGIKADDLATIHQPLLSLDDLQRLLQLPAPIHQSVVKVSEKHRCVVLIDQLDTLALTLNTDDQSLRIIVNLIDRLRALPNVTVVVSCRDFERMNDPVLGNIQIDQTFSVGNLSENDVNRALQSIGQPPLQELSMSLQKLVRTPLYLDIYAQIVISDKSSDHSQLATLQDLYRKLWSLRLEYLDSNAPTAAVRRKAVFHLVDLMQKKRKLKLHTSSLEDYPEARQYLLRTGFIQEQNHSLSFLHQTLFSYCFAVKFIRDQKSLSNEIFKSPQGFFERQLITEVIQHLRATDSETYHQEVNALLFPTEGTRVRYHIKLLMLKWLASQSNPTDFEYNLAIQVEQTNIDDFFHFLRIVGKNEGWFKKFRNDIPRWLRSSDSLIIRIAMNYLANFRDTEIHFLVEQLRPYVDRSSDWNQKISWIITRISDWKTAETAHQLLMHLVRTREISVRESSYTLVKMAQSNVIAGCKLLKLNCEIALRDYQQDPLMIDADRYQMPQVFRDAFDSWEARGFISVIAQYDPHLILEYFLDVFVAIADELSRSQSTNGRYYPHILGFNDLDETMQPPNRDGISLAKGIEVALKHLSNADPDEFRKIISRLSTTEIAIIQQIILRALRANPEEYLDEIYDYLLDDQRRLAIQPEARLLVGEAYRHSDDEFRDRWEWFIFSLSPMPLDTDQQKSLEIWRRYYRYTQADHLDFLVSIDESILSAFARRKKQELLRLPEFRNYKPLDGGRVTAFGQVQAPIPEQTRKRLSDDDWLRIFRKYDDKTDWGKVWRRRHILEGGVIEMSRALQEEVQQEPERFYLLSQKIDESISEKYISAFIQGFAKSEADANAPKEWKFQLFRRFHHKIMDHSRIGVGDAISRTDPGSVPDDIVQLLQNWAVNDPDPDCAKEKDKLPEIIERTSAFSDGMINRAINSVRSSALEDVCRILFSKESTPAQRIFEIIKTAIEDDCASVCTMAIDQLAHWQNLTKDSNRTTKLLERAIQKHAIILISRPLHNLLHWLIFTDPIRALPYLELLLELPHDHTQNVGAQLVCLGGLYKTDVFGSLSSNLHESESLAICRGAASVYAREISKPEKTTVCSERLLILMKHEDEQVRRQATSCFQKLEAKHLSQLQNFIRRFIKSPALQDGADDFIGYLVQSNLVTLDDQRLSLSFVKEFLDTIDSDLSNYHRGYFRFQRELTLYLRNLYDRTVNTQIREDVMDLFDDMLRLGSDEAHKMLEGEDSEWFSTA